MTSGRSRIAILYFLASGTRGGVEEHVLSLLQNLDRRRYAPILVCPPRLVAAFGEDLARLDVEVLPLELWSWSPRQLAQAWRFFRFLRRRRPHIVNPHMFRATLVAAPIAKLAGVPRVIATFHGREYWRRGLVKGSYVVDRFVDRWVDHMIAVCRSNKVYLVQTKGLEADKITVIQNGRDLGAYRLPGPGEIETARAELGVAADDEVLGVVGRLETQKGHRYLIEALPQILRVRPRARLLLVGEGDLRGALEEQASRLSVRERVVFTGFRRDVARMMGLMDVLVLPSLYEGLPLVLLEAQALARPIVATSVDGNTDVVEDGVSGRIVPPEDPAALAHAVTALLGDRDEARRLGEAARRSVHRHFTMEEQLRRTVELYEMCLQGR